MEISKFIRICDSVDRVSDYDSRPPESDRRFNIRSAFSTKIPGLIDLRREKVIEEIENIKLKNGWSWKFSGKDNSINLTYNEEVKHSVGVGDRPISEADVLISLASHMSSFVNENVEEENQYSEKEYMALMRKIYSAFYKGIKEANVEYNRENPGEIRKEQFGS